ncbi:HlyD family efflux transporter periplasmic adaptor subunit [Phragmitibacter flavus]|uniref:HlyD family efflux transporter periplasmic adaptor subunit n=1 Tax=Phragmitibacter flavus TaxID=2576071 RepID=A0A5R8K997_9BACT|nr:efflux RND transporter periplasmic adaptor subunit [Phragmitibacter flavus]TLD68883.1 HlyD family efflux transporter periplasmic adaptor subunit [Phragmitibacter flavus]
MPRPPRKKILGLLGILTAISLLAWFITGRGSDASNSLPTIPVQQGTIQINVLQGGEIRALSNHEVKCEIELPTKILSLIPEGYQITEEDVKNGKVLIELDSADLKERIINHEIEFQTTVSAYIEADEQRAIQTSDNQSLARAAEQSIRFALMDFERYMGKIVASQVLKARQLPSAEPELDAWIGTLNAYKPQISSLPTLQQDPLAEPDPKAQTDAAPTPAPATEPETSRINFITYLENDQLGDGEAKQTLRQLSNDLLLKESEFSIAKQNIEASERLAEKKFITKTTLETDQVNHEKSRLAFQTGGTTLDLFKTYEFPKQAELYLSAYEEALKNLQRTLRSNRSRMAQVESKFQTAKRRYEVSLQRKEDFDRQLKAAIIKAPVPGLIAYGSTKGGGYRSSDIIEEGATTRFRQTLLTIPNMSQMGVGVNIHESQVKKIRLGQACRVTIDAEPGRTLEGKVAELAVLPDSASSRFTPNLKVYPAVVHITGTHEWLKPGMNAKVEIIVDQLDDVLYVPVQSIEVENDHFFTYVNTGSGELERREVKTGSFNDQFIEIVGGLALGENVSLSIPKRQTLESAPILSAPKAPTAPAATPAPAEPKKETITAAR